MREGFLTLVGFLLTITPALAQTTHHDTGAYSGSNRRRGVADWWWVILLVLVIAAAIWYFMRRRAQP